jgi:uncharacterized Ntn-hydrolase superfamily protein
VATLEAAQRAGGDIRGKQSAALLVVRAESTGAVWQDRLVDLRVEDHAHPVDELARLLLIQRAYEHMNRGDEAMAAGDDQAALQAYQAAEGICPSNLEMQYWHAIALANVGRVAEALPIFDAVFGEDANWRTLTERLPQVDQLDVGEADLARILAQGAGR